MGHDSDTICIYSVTPLGAQESISIYCSFWALSLKNLLWCKTEYSIQNVSTRLKCLRCWLSHIKSLGKPLFFLYIEVDTST